MDNVEKLDMYPHNVESAKKIQERYKKGEKVLRYAQVIVTQ